MPSRATFYTPTIARVTPSQQQQPYRQYAQQQQQQYPHQYGQQQQFQQQNQQQYQYPQFPQPQQQYPIVPFQAQASPSSPYQQPPFNVPNAPPLLNPNNNNAMVQNAGNNTNNAGYPPVFSIPSGSSVLASPSAFPQSLDALPSGPMFLTFPNSQQVYYCIPYPVYQISFPPSHGNNTPNNNTNAQNGSNNLNQNFNRNNNNNGGNYSF
jgi:hypothetical protein